MNEIGPEELDEHGSGLQALLASQQSLLLSTVSVDGLPEISYAPYVRDEEGAFYIYISELARHTRNLLNKPHAAVLLIRPESESTNLFARERVVFQCRAKEIVRDDKYYDMQLDRLQEKFSEVVGLLRTLPDFHLFALTPEGGQYVVGFGRAFTIDIAEGSLSHLLPDRKNK